MKLLRTRLLRTKLIRARLAGARLIRARLAGAKFLASSSEPEPAEHHMGGHATELEKTRVRAATSLN